MKRTLFSILALSLLASSLPEVHSQPPPPIKPIHKPVVKHHWVLDHEDTQPTIRSNSEILLFVHGMDSRAEEADELTNTLFTALPGSASVPSLPNPNIAVLNQLLHKYQNCILEKYETQQDMVNRGLPANDSGLTTTNGLDPVLTVQCLDGSQCSMASRLATFTTLQVQANVGDSTNFETKLASAIPQDCFQCAKHQEMHTKHVHCTMEEGGNNGLIIGPKFEICQAGVDISSAANSIIGDIRNVVSDITNSYPSIPDATGGASIATNHTTVQPFSCANPDSGCPDQCDHEDQFDPSGVLQPTSVEFDKINGQSARVYFGPMAPDGTLDIPKSSTFDIPPAHNLGANEGRLNGELRTAAKLADPKNSLMRAAEEFSTNNNDLGNAFADLSVTGRRSFAVFKANVSILNEAFCQSSQITSQPGFDSQKMVIGCRKALDRAYRVANYLRTGQRGDTPTLKAAKTNERNQLKWIAVSGEDDLPHRPVNVPSSDFPQYDLQVTVEAPNAPAGKSKSITVNTRYTIAQSNGPAGKNLVVISVDLPTSGYADNLDYNQVSLLTDIGQATLTDFNATGNTALLDFIETFIVSFVDKLDATVTPTHSIEPNIRAVIGGSLGGNMTFRLGRRKDLTWLWDPLESTCRHASLSIL